MPGLEDWWEAFPSGTHTDNAGNTREWSEADIDRIIAATTARCLNDVPFVVGHLKSDTAPAYGWVAGLKKENGRLFIKGRDVMPEFAEMVRKKHYPKRSIALRPDMSIHHIAFLGGMPPAIKGMPDIQFSDSKDLITIEFGEQSSWAFTTIAGFMRRIREYFIEKEGADKADQIVSNWQIEDILAAAKETNQADQAAAMYTEKSQTKEATMGLKALFKKLADELPDDLASGTGAQGGQFSEADVAVAVEKARHEGIVQGKKDAQAEFAEVCKAERAKTRKAEITAFCEQRKKEGRLLKSWERLGLQEFMNSLDGERIIEFAEGDAGKKTQLDFMKAFLAELDKVIEFGEVARRDKDAGDGAMTAGQKLEKLVREKMKASHLSYSAAFSEVQIENPDLVREYQAELGGE